VGIGEMQAMFLAKIEELTLHQIEQEKLIQAQAARIAAQDARISELEGHRARAL
jgi:hypothetical protein